MSASAPALTKTWAVGRYTATLTVPPLAAGVMHAVIDWAPHVPNDLTADELQAYRCGRDSALQELFSNGNGIAEGGFPAESATQKRREPR